MKFNALSGKIGPANFFVFCLGWITLNEPTKITEKNLTHKCLWMVIFFNINNLKWFDVNYVMFFVDN